MKLAKIVKKKKNIRGIIAGFAEKSNPIQSNDAFSGRGHAKHICKECSALPQDRKNELQYINRIDRIAGKYPRSG